MHQLLGADNDNYEPSADSFGFTWLTRHGDPDDLQDLVGDLHTVNASLHIAGFGPALLCTLIVFGGDGGAPVGLVYLYKRGTWYPFVRRAEDKRLHAHK